MGSDSSCLLLSIPVSQVQFGSATEKYGPALYYDRGCTATPSASSTSLSSTTTSSRATAQPTGAQCAVPKGYSKPYGASYADAATCGQQCLADSQCQSVFVNGGICGFFATSVVNTVVDPSVSGQSPTYYDAGCFVRGGTRQPACGFQAALKSDFAGALQADKTSVASCVAGCASLVTAGCGSTAFLSGQCYYLLGTAQQNVAQNAKASPQYTFNDVSCFVNSTSSTT